MSTTSLDIPWLQTLTQVLMAQVGRHHVASPILAFPSAEDLTDYIFRIRDQCSEGGSSGDVYECWYDRNSDRKKVAVKSLRYKILMDDKSGMARRELGIWRRLDHPNVVPFLGTTTGFGVAGSKSLVSLWMPNGTLHNFLRRRESLENKLRLKLLLDIANGLDYLHSFSLPTNTAASNPNPIVHGDLNPANVLLDDDYAARLVDFGYASMIGRIPGGLAYLRKMTNRSGAIRWTAPEQVSSTSEVVHRTTESDIYSFGCIARQVLSGEEPWSELGEDVAVVLRLSQGGTPGRPGLIDDRHWQLIERCLSPSLNRPRSNSIICSIERFLEDFPGSRPPREVVQLPSSQDSKQPIQNGSSSSNPPIGPGDKATNGAIAPVPPGLSYPRQSRLSDLTGIYFDAPQSPSPSLLGSITPSEGHSSSPSPTQGRPQPWLFRKPRE